MKFIIFNGSPAGANSHTNVIAEAFLRGAKRGGADTENIFLIDKKIGHCKGCFTCWFKTPGKCILQDDMEALLPKYKVADVVCFATPIYTWNMTAVLKNFVDLLIPLKSTLIVQQNENFDLVDTVQKTQQFVVISNSGFPGNNNFETMKAVFSPCHPVLEIYRNCGKLLKSKDIHIKPIVDEYLAAVELAGFEMATQRAITKETKLKLDMPLMTINDYLKYLGM